MIGNGFQGINKSPDGKKIHSTRETKEVNTPFIHKRQSPKKLFSDILNSGVGATIIINYLFRLENQFDHQLGYQLWRRQLDQPPH